MEDEIYLLVGSPGVVVREPPPGSSRAPPPGIYTSSMETVTSEHGEWRSEAFVFCCLWKKLLNRVKHANVNVLLAMANRQQGSGEK